MVVIDSDQHLFERRDLWRDHIDPAHRDDALRIEDDALGHAWLRWRDLTLGAADVQVPGETDAIGERRRREREGLPPAVRYDDALPDEYWDPGARLVALDRMGLDAAVLFPNYGLLWERRLGERSAPAMLANMAAWNRWCAAVAADGRGRLHPVGHVALRDPEWLAGELAALERAGVRLAMVAPALVEGRPLSHPDHDRIWERFVAHGVTPVFHVADQPRVLDDAWYTDDDDRVVSALDSIFLWTPAALAVTDLIVNGAFERHPELRVGIVELSAVWVPMYLMMLDGGWAFTRRLNGRAPVELSRRPSDYFRDHVRVSAFAYELPARLIRRTGELYMCCSDFPHSEGTATPLDDYAAPAAGIDATASPALFAENVAWLLGDPAR
jgi:predicted TIM-barrel fold metal-dependent hydrolase